jgi:hypothetical protein
MTIGVIIPCVRQGHIVSFLCFYVHEIPEINTGLKKLWKIRKKRKGKENQKKKTERKETREGSYVARSSLERKRTLNK